MAAVKEPGSEDRTVSPRRRLELLEGIPAFSHLPTEVLEELASRLTEEIFRSADAVVVEGSTDDRLYLIVEGRAESSTVGTSGIVPLATLGPGELFGEISLLEPGSRRRSTVTAVEPLLLLSLHAADFRRALDAHPEARSAFEGIGRRPVGNEVAQAGKSFRHTRWRTAAGPRSPTRAPRGPHRGDHHPPG